MKRINGNRILWRNVIGLISLLISALLSLTVTAAPLKGDPASGYIKASNSIRGHSFSRMSISGDGRTLAVFSMDGSTSQGVYADQTGKKSNDSGAVHVYVKSTDQTWHHEAFIKSSNSDWYDFFGTSISLSHDGNAMAVGAENEGSHANGINGDQSNNDTAKSGAVYMFHRDKNKKWRQTDYIKASNTGKGDRFGFALSLSGDGRVLAVGAKLESSKSTGINGDQSDNSVLGSGAVYVFKKTRASWRQTAYIKAPQPKRVATFGKSVYLNYQGDLLLAGAPVFRTKSNTGKAFLYRQHKGKWNYVQELLYPGQRTIQYGLRLAMNKSGKRLAIAASGACNQVNHTPYVSTGVVFIFTKKGDRWQGTSALQPTELDAGDCFGSAIAMNAAGDRVLVGASGEDSGSRLLNQSADNNSLDDSGAAYLFERDKTGQWRQKQYIKPHNPQAGSLFGLHAAVDAAGETIAVSAIHESSDAQGVGGDGFNGNARSSGAVYVFSRNTDGSWVQGIPTH